MHGPNANRRRSLRMPSIKFPCPHCGMVLYIEDEDAGTLFAAIQEHETDCSCVPCFHQNSFEEYVKKLDRPFHKRSGVKEWLRQK